MPSLKIKRREQSKGSAVGALVATTEEGLGLGSQHPQGDSSHLSHQTQGTQSSAGPARTHAHLWCAYTQADNAPTHTYNIFK